MATVDEYTITQSTVNSAMLIVFSAVVTFLAAWFWHSRNQAIAKAAAIAIDHLKLVDQVAELKTAVSVANTSVMPIVAAMQALLVKGMTHEDTPEMDDLLVKSGPPDTLTPTERDRLMVLLKERTEDYGNNITQFDRDAATIYPIIMRMSAVEQENFDHATAESANMKTITIVSVVGGTKPVPPPQIEDEPQT